MWLMLVNEEHSIVFPAEKRGTMLKIVPKDKKEEEWELKLTSSILTPKKTCYTKEAKPKEEEWL
jgi:hypothetical protein